MDASFRSRILSPLLFALTLIAILSFATQAQAYDEYSHEWITRSAFNYLKSNPYVYPETKLWIEGLGQNESLFEESLVRSVVDTDYHSDVWLSAWFHGAIDGGETNNVLAMFTTMFHFLTVVTPGRYWQYDGYSYGASTKKGNDSYLNEPSVTLQGADSVPLGGAAPDGHAIHGADLGTYDTGFKGDQKNWTSLYFGSAASNAVFPPSYVPAEIAYAALMKSTRAASDLTDSWTETQPLVTGVFSNENLNREYWRGQVEGLPQYIDLLGMVIHLTQDTTVPHHVEDTSDRCHAEYERAVDQWACGTTQALDYTAYYDGEYGSDGPTCDSLYDPALVSQLITDHDLLDPTHPLSVRDRMIQSAVFTSQWDWRISLGKNYSTLLPDGSLYTADTCQEILSEADVRTQAKIQFNLAVAESVSLIELAAHQYETAHAGELAPLPLTLSWFRMN